MPHRSHHVFKVCKGRHVDSESDDDDDDDDEDTGTYTIQPPFREMLFISAVNVSGPAFNH